VKKVKAHRNAKDFAKAFIETARDVVRAERGGEQPAVRTRVGEWRATKVA